MVRISSTAKPGGGGARPDPSIADTPYGHRVTAKGQQKFKRLACCPASTQHPAPVQARRNLEGRLPLGACRKAGEGNGSRSWQGDARARLARRSGGGDGPGAVKAGAGWIQIRSSRGLKIRGGMGGCFSGGMGGGTISMLRSPHS